MADSFGAISFPIADPECGQAVSDPLISNLSSYLAAVLNADLGAAWGDVSNHQMVKHHFNHDPERGDISDQDFPALYVWRADSGSVDLGDDFSSEISRIKILWIFEPEQQLRLVPQLAIFNGMSKSIKRALLIGRHPAWVHDDETDASIKARGSLIWRYAGATSHRYVKGQPDVEIVVELYEGGKLQAYSACLFEIDCTEVLIQDATNQPGSAEAGLTANVTHPDNGDLRLGAVEDPPEAV